jgi:rod shape determining protein RodA
MARGSAPSRRTVITERRLLRAEPDFGLLTKLFRINWIYVLLLCALAGCGYVALYSAGGGPEPYAWRHGGQISSR